MKKTLRSLDEMQQFATEVVASLSGGTTLLLLGTLGSGKTTFVQALARALGVEQKVISPTFTVIAEYKISTHPTLRTLVHADLYRLEGEHVASDPAVRDVLERAQEVGRLTVIEWAERLGRSPSIRGAAIRRIQFEHGKTAEERVVTFTA